MTVLFPDRLVTPSLHILVDQVVMNKTGIMKQLGKSGHIQCQFIIQTEARRDPNAYLSPNALTGPKVPIIKKNAKEWVAGKTRPEPPV
jgi:hypothetical protein